MDPETTGPPLVRTRRNAQWATGLIVAGVLLFFHTHGRGVNYSIWGLLGIYAISRSQWRRLAPSQALALAVCCIAPAVRDSAIALHISLFAALAIITTVVTDTTEAKPSPASQWLRRLLRTAIPTAAATAVTLIAASNPDAARAHKLLASAERLGNVDLKTASHLSADAAPTLVAGLSQLPEPARGELAQEILVRWSPSPADVRTWNLGRIAAWNTVTDHAETLQWEAARYHPVRP